MALGLLCMGLVITIPAAIALVWGLVVLSRM